VNEKMKKKKKKKERFSRKNNIRSWRIIRRSLFKTDRIKF
jgi:hypothetical protein